MREKDPTHRSALDRQLRLAGAGAALVLGALACGLLGSAAQADEPAPGKKRPPKSAPEELEPASVCARVQARVQVEGYGYTHIVGLHSRCKKPVVCEVWTDVDPTPRQSLYAAPGKCDEVTTRKGSPSRAVKAESICRYGDFDQGDHPPKACPEAVPSVPDDPPTY